MHGSRRTLACAGLLFLVCVGFYWKILFTDQYTYLDSPDLANMELPRFQFIASEIRHLRFPLWDPNLWCGQPFLGQFTGAAYPLNWILPPLRFSGGKVSIPLLHWLYVLIHFQGALFAFLLCRDLGRSYAASILACLVFALGAFLGSTDWPQVLNGAVWGPAVFLFLLRAERGKRPVGSAAMAGLCLGLAWLSGHHEVPMYISVAALGFWGWALARGSASRRRITVLAILMFAIAVLTSGLQTIPGVEYGRLAKRWAGWPDPLAWNQPVPYTVHERYSFTPASLLGIVVPGLFEHVDPYLGVAAFVFMLLGVVMAWRKEPPVRLFAALGLAALLFAMAANTWMHGLLYAVLPGFGKARVPARMVVLFNLAAAPLLAYGFDAVRNQPFSPWLRRAAAALSGLALVAFAGAAAFWLAKNQPAASPLLAAALAALLLAAALWAWRARAISAHAFAVCAALLALWELGNVNGARLPNLKQPDRPSPLARLLENDDIAAFLRAQPGPPRVGVNDQDIPANFGDWQGVEMPGGYMAGVTSNLLEIETYKPRIQDLLGVQFTVSRQPTHPGQEIVFTGRTGIHVYRNPGAFPRARIVHQAVRVPSHADRRKLYDDAGFDLRRTATLLVEPPPLETCAEEGESAGIASRRAGSVTMQATLNCRGMVVLADTWFPGWKATVDGAPARIYEADGALRGVAVERGTHRIHMTYAPVSVYLGAAMTLLGIVGALALYYYPHAHQPS